MNKQNIQNNKNLKAVVLAAVGATVAADVRVANATAAVTTAEAVVTETAETLARAAVQFQTFINNFLVEGGEYRSFMGILSDVGFTHPNLVKWVRKQKWIEAMSIWREGQGYTRNSFLCDEDWNTFLELRGSLLQARNAYKNVKRKLVKKEAALKAAKKEATKALLAEKSAIKDHKKAKKEMKENKAVEAAAAVEEARQERARKRAEKVGPKNPPKQREFVSINGLDLMLAWIESRKAAVTKAVVLENTAKLAAEANAAANGKDLDGDVTNRFVKPRNILDGFKLKLQMFGSKVRVRNVLKGNRKGFKAVMGPKAQVAIKSIIVDGSDVMANGEGIKAMAVATTSSISYIVRTAIRLSEEKGWAEELVLKNSSIKTGYMDGSIGINSHREMTSMEAALTYMTAEVSANYVLNGLVSIHIDKEDEEGVSFTKGIRQAEFIIIDGVKYIPLMVESVAKTRLYDTVWTAEHLANQWREVLRVATGGISDSITLMKELTKALKLRSRLGMGFSPSYEFEIELARWGVVYLDASIDAIDGQAYGSRAMMEELLELSGVNSWQVRTNTGKGQLVPMKGMKRLLAVLCEQYGLELVYVSDVNEVQTAIDAAREEGKRVAIVVGNAEHIGMIGDMNFFKGIPTINDGGIVRLSVLRNLAPTGNGSHFAYQAAVGALCSYEWDNKDRFVKALATQAVEKFTETFNGCAVNKSVTDLFAALVGVKGLAGEANIISELANSAFTPSMYGIKELSYALRNEQQVVRGSAWKVSCPGMKDELFNEAVLEGAGLLVVEGIVSNNNPLLKQGDWVMALRYPHSNGFSFVKIRLVTVSEAIERVNNSSASAAQKAVMIDELLSLGDNNIMVDSSREVLEALAGMDFDGDVISVLNPEEAELLLPMNELRTVIAPIVTKAQEKELVATGNFEDTMQHLQSEMAANETKYVGEISNGVMKATEFLGLPKDEQRKIVAEIVRNGNLSHNGLLPTFNWEEQVTWVEGKEGFVLSDESTTPEALVSMKNAFFDKVDERNYSVESFINFAEYVVIMSGPTQGFVIDAAKKFCPIVDLAEDIFSNLSLGWKRFAPTMVLTCNEYGEFFKGMSYNFGEENSGITLTVGTHIQVEAFKAFAAEASKAILNTFAGEDASKANWKAFEDAMKKESLMSLVGGKMNSARKNCRNIAAGAAAAIKVIDNQIAEACGEENIPSKTMKEWSDALGCMFAVSGTINPLGLRAYASSKTLRPAILKAMLDAAEVTSIPVEIGFTSMARVAFAKANVGEEVFFENSKAADANGVILLHSGLTGYYKVSVKTEEVEENGETISVETYFVEVPVSEVLGIEPMKTNRFVAHLGYEGADAEVARKFNAELTKFDFGAEGTFAFYGTMKELNNLMIEKFGEGVLRDALVSTITGLKNGEDVYSQQFVDFIALANGHATNPKYAADDKHDRVFFVRKDDNGRVVVMRSLPNQAMAYNQEAFKLRGMFAGELKLVSYILEGKAKSDKKGYVNSYLLLEHKTLAPKQEISAYINGLIAKYAADFKAAVLAKKFELGCFGSLVQTVLSDEEIIG